MEYKTLSNGVKMPMLGYGTYRVTASIEAKEIVQTAINQGYRLLDTAQAYGNEEAVGDGIKQSGIARDELFLTTKVWFTNYEDGGCEKSVYESLKKLGTDYLDLVLLHWPYGNYYRAWKDLEKLYKAGTIRAIGVSNFDPGRLVDFISFNEISPMLNQIEVHLYCQRKEARTWMKKYDVACQAYAPLGKNKLNEMFDIPEVKEIAVAHKKTTAQIMLRFLVQSDVLIIPKSAQANRIKENFEIFDFTLSDSEMKVLKDLDRDYPIEGIPERPEKVEAMRDRILFQG